MNNQLRIWVPGDASAPRVVSDAAGLMGALNLLLRDPDHPGLVMRVYHERALEHGSCSVDHEMLVAVDRARGVGALRYDAERRWHTLGSAPAAGILTVGAVCDYPDDSEISLNDLFAALLEFMSTGKRPTCVSWQEDPEELE